LIPVVQLNLVQ